jgi:predicted DNA-binding transcriptional regulator AlpA
MKTPLSKKEAVKYTGLSEKTFDNYFKNALEFPCIKRVGARGRFYFDEEILSKWKEGVIWRTVKLNKDDYALCLDFALAQHFRNYVQSDFGTGRQREFGQKITNWVKGQLGEVAVKKFLKREFDIDVELDFNIRDQIVLQDITGIKNKGKTRVPKIGVGIKSSKPKSAFLILGANEINIKERRSDIYIYCRPDIPDDHLLRITKEEINKIVKGKPHYPMYKDLIPEFTIIPCEVVGWCKYSDLRETNKIPGQDFDGTRFVKESGLLRKSKKDWQELIKQL